MSWCYSVVHLYRLQRVSETVETEGGLKEKGKPVSIAYERSTLQKIFRSWK